MARTITFFTLAIITLWSLLSLGAWAVFSVGGDVVYRQLDWMFGGDPNVVPVAGGIFRFFQNLGLGLVFIVWAFGSVSVWLVGTIMNRLVRSLGTLHVREGAWTERYEYEIERPMKDVTPPRPSRALPRD